MQLTALHEALAIGLEAVQALADSHQWHNSSVVCTLQAAWPNQLAVRAPLPGVRAGSCPTNSLVRQVWSA